MDQRGSAVYLDRQRDQDYGAPRSEIWRVLRLQQAGQQPATQETPVFTFASQGNNSFVSDTNNGVANLVLGNYFNVTQGNGIFFGAFRFHQFEMYGQDTWKLNRKLTLDYGLRWAYIGPTYTVKPFLQYYFDPSKYDPAQ